MKYEFDVIVVGSGMSGGWAAKEFCEKGFKTLVLDRGHAQEHGDYKFESRDPWDLPNAGKINDDVKQQHYATVSKCYAFQEQTQDFFIKDSDYPYETPECKTFDWIRPASVGGKSLMWARQSYRFSPMDFEANKKDGFGTDWPVRYDDLAPWYDYVEKFAGISGSKENLPQLPDSIFQKPHVMTAPEKNLKTRVEETYKGRKVIMGRVAQLTEPTEEQMELGRGQCQSRNECHRGCSWGGYFSSLAATLPAAERTGNMTLKADAVVHSIIHDEATGKALGVRVIDAKTGEKTTITARVIFMCASTLSTTQILLNSQTEKYPTGIGNSSGVLGHYLMDHVNGGGARGRIEGYDNVYFKGRRPTGLYIPRFRNITEPTDKFLRGYGFQGGAGRGGWQYAHHRKGIGVDYKNSIQKPSSWGISFYGFGEMLPRYENAVRLSKTSVDKHGIPALHIDCAYSDNELKMREDMADTATEILKAAGVKDVERQVNHDAKPGIVIHEVGTARMGRDPATSYLNGYNQSHEVDNLFITDGAAFASIACQNPSLTFMAFTARAADYASEHLKAGVL